MFNGVIVPVWDSYVTVYGQIPRQAGWTPRMGWCSGGTGLVTHQAGYGGAVPDQMPATWTSHPIVGLEASGRWGVGPGEEQQLGGAFCAVPSSDLSPHLKNATYTRATSYYVLRTYGQRWVLISRPVYAGSEDRAVASTGCLLLLTLATCK